MASGDYLAPRLSEPDGAIVVAVVGPGGSGKSTIVNSLAGRSVADTGPLRPTTLEPVAWTAGGLPATLYSLRTDVPGSLVDSLRPPPEGIVIVDAPPPELLDSQGIPVAHRLIEVADAVLLVAGASRYADAESFALLDAALARGLPTVVVLNRVAVASEARQAVASDFASKLAARRILPRPDAELITTVAESVVSPETGALVTEAVAGVRKDMEALADPQSRPEVIAQAVGGTLALLREDLRLLRGDVIDSVVHRIRLLDPMQSAYRTEGHRLVAEIKAGRFADVDRTQVVDRLAASADARAARAARATAEAWHGLSPGLIDADPSLFGAGAATLDTGRERLEFWMGELDDLPRSMSSRRVSRRAQRRLTRAAREAALDPKYSPDKRTLRSLRRCPDLFQAASDRLADELVGILDTDAIRFASRVGGRLPAGVLVDLGAPE